MKIGVARIGSSQMALGFLSLVLSATLLAIDVGATRALRTPDDRSSIIITEQGRKSVANATPHVPAIAASIVPITACATVPIAAPSVPRARANAKNVASPRRLPVEQSMVAMRSAPRSSSHRTVAPSAVAHNGRAITAPSARHAHAVAARQLADSHKSQPAGFAPRPAILTIASPIRVARFVAYAPVAHLSTMHTPIVRVAAAHVAVAAVPARGKYPTVAHATVPLTTVALTTVPHAAATHAAATQAVGTQAIATHVAVAHAASTQAAYSHVAVEHVTVAHVAVAHIGVAQRAAAHRVHRTVAEAGQYYVVQALKARAPGLRSVWVLARKHGKDRLVINVMAHNRAGTLLEYDVLRRNGTGFAVESRATRTIAALPARTAQTRLAARNRSK